MGLPMLPVELVEEPLRSKIATVSRLGGDTRFFQFAAQAPHVVELYWGHFYRDVFFAGVLPVRTKEIVRLRLAGLNGCSFCQAGDRESALKNGVSAEEVDALFSDGRASTFTLPEQAAADAASRMSNAELDGLVEPELLDHLAHSFTPAELVELVTVIGLLTGMARMLMAMGFTTRTCPLPGIRA